MGDETRAVDPARFASGNGSQPRVGVGVLLVDELGSVLLTLRKFPPEVGVGALSAASWIFWSRSRAVLFAKRSRKWD